MTLDLPFCAVCAARSGFEAERACVARLCQPSYLVTLDASPFFSREALDFVLKAAPAGDEAFLLDRVNDRVLPVPVVKLEPALDFADRLDK